VQRKGYICILINKQLRECYFNLSCHKRMWIIFTQASKFNANEKFGKGCSCFRSTKFRDVLEQCKPVSSGMQYIGGDGGEKFSVQPFNVFATRVHYRVYIAS
jgi:hypothetical protein